MASRLTIQRANDTVFCVFIDKNIARHTAYISASWPNHKQWLITHISDLIVMTRWGMNILTTINRETGKLKTHSPMYCIKCKWENWFDLKHTFDRKHLKASCMCNGSRPVCIKMIMRVQYANEYDSRGASDLRPHYNFVCNAVLGSIKITTTE